MDLKQTGRNSLLSLRERIKVRADLIASTFAIQTSFLLPDHNRAIRRALYGFASGRANRFAFRSFLAPPKSPRSLSWRPEMRSLEKSPSDSQDLSIPRKKGAG